MNIEDLSKSQTILLTLLVSFVTSIATGIVTVALLQQAPPAVTQTVNRVIQNTIEKIVPQAINPSVQTIIVKEEDLIGEAIAENTNNLVAVKESAGEQAGATLGSGFIVSKDGIVVTDAGSITEGAEYYVVANAVAYKATVAAKDSRGFALLRILPFKDEKGNLRTFGSVTFGDSDALVLGQTLVAPSSLDGESLSVAKGTVSRFLTDTATPSAPKGIEMTWALGKAHPGSPLLDTEGEVVGVIIATDGQTRIISSAILKAAIAGLPAVQS